MLAGQSIGASDSLLISLVGMAVVMIELGLLCAFVLLLSKVVAKFVGKGAGKKAETPVPPPVAAVSADSAVTEEEIAAIAVSVCAESGLRPDQFRIVSITSNS